MRQQGEVVLVSTDLGTDILEIEGYTVLDGGLAAACKIAMFGGNRDDTGVSACRCQWWGNEGATDRQTVRSRTQRLLLNSPLTSAIIPKIVAAVLADLAFLRDSGAVDEIDVRPFISTGTSVQIAVRLFKDRQSTLFETYQMETAGNV